MTISRGLSELEFWLLNDLCVCSYGIHLHKVPVYCVDYYGIFTFDVLSRDLDQGAFLLEMGVVNWGHRLTAVVKRSGMLYWTVKSTSFGVFHGNLTLVALMTAVSKQTKIGWLVVERFIQSISVLLRLVVLCEPDVRRVPLLHGDGLVTYLLVTCVPHVWIITHVK